MAKYHLEAYLGYGLSKYDLEDYPKLKTLLKPNSHYDQQSPIVKAIFTLP